MSEKSITEGSLFQQFCSVEEGSNPLFFEWSRNGQTLRSGPEVNYKIENSEIFSTLTIKKINRKDSGNYTCLVTNAYGSDSQHVMLTVKGISNKIIYIYFKISNFMTKSAKYLNIDCLAKCGAMFTITYI